MEEKSQKSGDLWSGLTLAALGVYLVAEARQWDYLAPAGLGAGFFPMWVRRCHDRALAGPGGVERTAQGLHGGHCGELAARPACVCRPAGAGGLRRLVENPGLCAELCAIHFLRGGGHVCAAAEERGAGVMGLQAGPAADSGTSRSVLGTGRQPVYRQRHVAGVEPAAGDSVGTAVAFTGAHSWFYSCLCLAA